jgi:hypothetical protein
MKYEEKFIVINIKHLEEIIKNNPLSFDNIIFMHELYKLSKLLPNNKYYVCNQDEPYASEVFKIISKGEDKKELEGK